MYEQVSHSILNEILEKLKTEVDQPRLRHFYTRLGANFSGDEGGSWSMPLPCQYIVLAECGCGPSDMYTFGLPNPTGPCVPEGGCPLMCEDAGPQYARNLCRTFPETSRGGRARTLSIPLCSSPTRRRSTMNTKFISRRSTARIELNPCVPSTFHDNAALLERTSRIPL